MRYFFFWDLLAPVFYTNQNASLFSLGSALDLCPNFTVIYCIPKQIVKYSSFQMVSNIFSDDLSPDHVLQTPLPAASPERNIFYICAAVPLLLPKAPTD